MKMFEISTEGNTLIVGPGMLSYGDPPGMYQSTIPLEFILHVPCFNPRRDLVVLEENTTDFATRMSVIHGVEGDEFWPKRQLNWRIIHRLIVYPSGEVEVIPHSHRQRRTLPIVNMYEICSAFAVLNANLFWCGGERLIYKWLLVLRGAVEIALQRLLEDYPHLDDDARKCLEES